MTSLCFRQFMYYVAGLSNKRQLKLTAFTNKVRTAADYSFDGFNMFKTLIDGNCMFAALAHQLNMEAGD